MIKLKNYTSDIMYWFWHSTGTYYFNTFLSPNVIVMSVGLFIWLVKGNVFDRVANNQFVTGGLRYISALSYGVYLVHFSVMDWIDIRHGYAIEFVTVGLREFVVDRTIWVVLISFVIAMLLRMIPGLRVVVGESLVKRKRKRYPI